ncbi:hypothetical protein COPR103792_05585 [Corynebacterium propinquum]|uniref:hypothetical protein n=1 Tax=Corynebacterium propinquum TaxID=43769 RepID=UPI000AABC066|nr:hypothetical protein [Corynebacterium propinquum]QQU91506.1 hypothetical protein I6I69_04710 [Corynebacterium propinquum]
MRFTRSLGPDKTAPGKTGAGIPGTGTRRRKASLAAVLASGALVLAACGSATVEDEEPETLSKSSTTASESTAASSSKSKDADKDSKDGKDGKSSKESEKKDSGANTAGHSNAEPAPQAGGSGGSRDRGAQEIDEIPDTNNFEGDNAAFLDDVRALGVDVGGVEGQVISAGYLVCDDQTAILQAVAGQLIGQDRTDREFEDLADNLAESARKHFC